MSSARAKPWLAFGLAAVLVTGCASPLFVDDGDTASPGRVPRDEMGEPVWDEIQPNTDKD